MDNDIKGLFDKKSYNAASVRKVQPLENEICLSLKALESVDFQIDIIIVIEIIKADDFVPIISQSFREMIANKPGCAGNEYSLHKELRSPNALQAARFDCSRTTRDM